MPEFKDVASVKVLAEVEGTAPPVIVWLEGVISKSMAAPGAALWGRGYEPAYEVDFPSIGKRHIVAERLLEAV